MAAAASEEDKRVEELLSYKDVQSVLLDGDIQNFISLLKTDSEKAHRLALSSRYLFLLVHIHDWNRFLSQANAEFKQKVHLLVSKGILAVQ